MIKPTGGGGGGIQKDFEVAINNPFSPDPVHLLHQGLSYDLGDAAIWEFFFPNVEKPLLVIPGEEIILGDDESEEPKVLTPTGSTTGIVVETFTA